MTNYSQGTGTWYSTPFYTGQHDGYKLQLLASSSSSGGYVSVGVHLMCGENDEYLLWPFNGSVDVKLLNWIEDENHLEHTFTSSSPIPRPTTSSSLAIGTNKEYRVMSDSTVQYMMDDVLCFVISGITVRSTGMCL